MYRSAHLRLVQPVVVCGHCLPELAPGLGLGLLRGSVAGRISESSSGTRTDTVQEFATLSATSTCQTDFAGAHLLLGFEEQRLQHADVPRTRRAPL